jgi:hypothetical protein
MLFHQWNKLLSTPITKCGLCRSIRPRKIGLYRHEPPGTLDGEEEGAEMKLPHLYNTVTKAAGGNISKAAADLADRIEYDDDVRKEVAITIIALLLEPGFSEHQRTFLEATGGSLSDFVTKHCPT